MKISSILAFPSLMVSLVISASALKSKASAEEARITAVEETANNTLEVHFTLPADRYAVLYRSFGLDGTGQRPIAMAQGDGGPQILTDTAPFARRGFLTLKSYATNAPGDADGDGIDDLTEFSQPYTHNAFNPATVVDVGSGGQHIPDLATFERISHRDDFPGAADIREVKFLLSDLLTASPSMHFIDISAFEHHFDFSRDVLGDYTDSSTFISETYFTNVNRHNFAGSLIAHDNYEWPDGRRGIYTIESWPTDAASFRFIETAFEMVSAAAPFLEGKLAYHPSSETQRALYRAEIDLYESSHVPVITTEELFGNQTYAALNPGVTYGRLKVATGGETLTARDIVIFVNIPNDVTHLAGIITEIPQTPLSHINLKAKQNNTPNAFIKRASTEPEIASFLDQFVRLEISAEGYDIRSATEAEVESHFESLRPLNPQTPVRNLSETSIEPLDDLRFENADAFGSKAANLAELRTIMPEITPNGWAIPYYFYDEFMKYNGYYAEAQAMMSDPDFIASPEIREQRLAEFRERIEDYGSMPFWMIIALGDMQAQFPADTSMRARSSTNNEDLQGFNGAGLYESYTHHPDEGHFSKTAKQVWAGLWTYRAFEEREFWRINHMVAAMGILVHPNFSDEVANGVGVTTNPYAPSPNWDGHYVNVQLGENLVTNPDPNTVPEEYTIAQLSLDDEYEIQYIRFSNLVAEGETILSREQALQLNDAMNAIDAHYDVKYGDDNSDMELEFKIDSEGKLFIKQVRPWLE